MITLYLKKIDPEMGQCAQSKLAHELLFSLGIAKSGDKIVKNRFGKPYIENSERYFNISHTKGAIAIVAADCEVGVDIEFPRMISDAAMKRFVGSADGDAFTRTKAWTRCEAHAKWLSCGLPITLPDREHKFFEYSFFGIPVCVCTDPVGDDIIVKEIDD